MVLCDYPYLLYLVNFLESGHGWHGWFFKYFFHSSVFEFQMGQRKVFKNGPSEIFGRQPLKNLK